MTSSVIVLEPDDVAPDDLIPRATGWQRVSNRRRTVLVGVVAAHAALLGLAVVTPSGIPRRPQTESLVSVFIRPNVIVSRNAAVPPRAIRVAKAAPMLYRASAPEIERPTMAIIGIGTMPPQPDDDAIDVRPFAERSGLALGEGATVVLRIEILESGVVGHVDVEVSGGSADIDRAAVAYTRSLPWIGGRIDGQPATLWVRRAVRLQL